jgi:hypothetical protein
VAFLKPASATADIVISNAAGQTLYRGTVSTGGVFVYPTFSNVSLYVVHVQTGLETTHKKIVK